MQQQKRILTLLLAFLLVLPLVSAAVAEATPADLPETGDYVIRIDGGYVSEHLETVNDSECLRVDLFLDGVTSERLLSSIQFKLIYDADQLTFVKYKSLSGSMNAFNANVSGLIQYAYTSTGGTLLNGTKPLLTLWFTVAEDLPAGTRIRFAFSEAIKADSIAAGSFNSQKRTVGAKLRPFGIGPILGDANCDCLITASDAALVLRMLVGLNALSDMGTENAKVAGQGKVTAEDAALILRYVVGLIERFPAEN